MSYTVRVVHGPCLHLCVGVRCFFLRTNLKDLCVCVCVCLCVCVSVSVCVCLVFSLMHAV